MTFIKGQHPWNRGRKISDATREKIRAARLTQKSAIHPGEANPTARKWWAELKDDPIRYAAYLDKLHARPPAWNRGIPMREESKKKLSAYFKGRSNVALIGRHHSEETRAKISAAKTGMKMTEETKRKMSYTKRGHAVVPYDRRPRGPAHHNYGKPAPKGSGIGKGSYCAKGHWVRSSWERGIADWLYKQNIAYEYEPKLFDFGNGLRYRPDFYLPGFDRWYECKGYMTERDKQKIAAFRAVGHSLFIIDRPWWRLYTNGRDDLPQEYMVEQEQ